MKPLVSIIIPVYNGENYLYEAIDSALSQTYKPIEILVVNDGSNDSTEKIALTYKDKIRYFSKENGGVSTALNLGITQMQGEYFSWLSHDDLYESNKIDCQINALSKDKKGIAYSDYIIIDKNGIPLAHMDIKKKYPDADLTNGLFPVLRQVLSGCTMLIHKSHFDRVGIFDETLRATQDYDLWFRMLRNTKIVYINKPLQMSREHGLQVTHRYERNLLESDELWMSMLKSITSKEACQIEGTEKAFWDTQYEFLRYTQYRNAKLYARGRLKALGGGKFSLRKFARASAYKALSGVSKFIKLIGLQRIVKNSKLFAYGYKLWFGMRYK